MELNKIYNEDCLGTMANMPDEFVDLVVTSPPYDDLRVYKGFSFDFEAVAKELFRVIKKGGVVVWVVADSTKDGDESGTSFKQALFFKSLGFKLYDTMIFQKKNPPPKNHPRYEHSFDYMFVFSKEKPKTFNPIMVKCKLAGKNANETFRNYNEGVKTTSEKVYVYKEYKIKKNIWEYGVGFTKIAGHVATFPQKLADDHIVSWSNEGDLVYDPFIGSGTTASAAKLKNRNFIGSEISTEYCEIAEKRLKILENECNVKRKKDDKTA